AREVTIAAKLEENGITLRTKSRAVAALDRLVGSFFDLPAAFFEGVARKKRLKDEIYERLKNAQAQVAEQQIAGSPALGTPLINDILEDRARKQANVACVAVEAVDAIKALPPPETDAGAGARDAAEEEIDEDWMNQFTRFAEDASSERLQQVWGRVLAGEVRKPGSFSRHTLRFISELDKETAENCEFLARHRIGPWVFKGEMWNSGREFLVSVDLQRLGIIEGATGVGGPQQNFTVDANGHAAIAGDAWGLLITGTPGATLTLQVFLLTRMGQEVMTLVGGANEKEELQEIANRLDKENVQAIALRPILKLPDGRVNFSAMQPIWAKDASNSANA
ncbi:MAG: hypothetical protein B7Z43_05635, partial [Sphingomonas sp. 12-62-6]